MAPERRTRMGAAVAVVPLLVALAGCGGDDVAPAGDTSSAAAGVEHDDAGSSHDGAGSGHAGEEMAGDGAGGHQHDLAFGHPASPEEADRTVEVTASEMAFDPASITVAPGETVRFVVTNAGTVDHEFTIGDEEFHAHHAEDMAAMGEGEMHHADGNGVDVEPGRAAELTWWFPNESGVSLTYVCHVPGHREGGMVGSLQVDG